MEYTAIGDTVNVASRLEEATKTFNVPILVSETTFLNAKEDFTFEELGQAKCEAGDKLHKYRNAPEDGFNATAAEVHQ